MRLYNRVCRSVHDALRKTSILDQENVIGGILNASVHLYMRVCPSVRRAFVKKIKMDILTKYEVQSYKQSK